MRRSVRCLLLAAAALCLLVPSAPAEAQTCTMNVTGQAYFSTNYGVGLSCSWNPVSGASSYLVKHYRKDACGEATVYVQTTSTSSSSGTHPNCDPDSCYYKSCEVSALDSRGVVLNCGSASICETGCSGGGSCPTCDADGFCDAGEDQWNCPSDCPGCEQGKFCKDSSWCNGGFCSGNACQCL